MSKSSHQNQPQEHINNSNEGKGDELNVIESLEFFKKKLIEAESYIEMLEMRKKEIEGLMQQTSVKSQGQEQEIAGLLAKLEEAKTERISLNQIISELKNKNQEQTHQFKEVRTSSLA